MKPYDVFRKPTPVNIMGRSSSLTNSFINGIIPYRQPSNQDIVEALGVLELDIEDLRCAYCGDAKTEWDHFRPLIIEQMPTGCISEIQNLVPACGKCNQSKGNSHWRVWMLGNAKLCPRVRGVANLERRVACLDRFENWREPTQLDIPEVVGKELWDEYRESWKRLLDVMQMSQHLASKLKAKLQAIDYVPRTQDRKFTDITTHRGTICSADEAAVVIERLRMWANKPHSNVHRIIGIVVRAGGNISRDQLIKMTKDVTGSKNAYGAIASLLTTNGNAYGRVFEERDGMIYFNSDISAEIHNLDWK